MMLFAATLFCLCINCLVSFSKASSIDELHHAAVAAFRSNNSEEALKLLKEAIEREPTNPLLLNTAGVVLNRMGQVDHAADYFATSLKHDPTGFNANYNAANLVHFTVYNNNPNFTEALDSSIGYYKSAIDSMMKLNETENAVSMEEQINLLNDASIALKKRSRFGEAIELLQKVIEIDPNNVQALANLAVSYLDSGADLKQAIKVSKMAIDRDPDNDQLRKNHAVMLQKLRGNDDNVDNDEVVFCMTFEYKTGISKESYNINIQLKRNDDPVAVVKEIQSKLDLDLLTYHWVYRNLHHATERLKEDIVYEIPMVIDEKKFPSIKIHFGDDLYSLSRSYVHMHSLPSELSDVIYEQIKSKVPQHVELLWVNRRKSQFLTTKPSSTMINNVGFLSASRQRLEVSGNCKTTLAIVSSGKFELFHNLIQKLPQFEVCEVLVFDSLSPQSSRARMMTDFPQFTFIFFPDQERGHAKTLNKILMLAKSNYLLYLDDTWEPLDDVNVRISKALILMEAGNALGMPIAQVFMNEQSSKSCALGISLEECRNNNFYGKAGWPRSVTFGDTTFEYLEHEFGVQYLDHQSSSIWPGFSSRHPSLWNLNLLTSRMDRMFNEDNDAYDALFSLGVLEDGMSVAHMKDVGFRYIGE